MIAATKAVQAPGLTVSSNSWLRRLWRTVSKVADRKFSQVDDATSDVTISAPPATLTQGYLQTLNALHETIEVNPYGYGYSVLSDDCDADDEPERADPVATIIQESLSGLAADPAFRFFDHTYTVRCSCGDEPSSLEVTKTPSDTTP